MEKQYFDDIDIELTPKQKEKLKVILMGIDFKNNPEKYQDDTWDTLNEKLGEPYKNGESFRSAVKNFQKKLRTPDGTPLHPFALPLAQDNDSKILEIQKEKIKISSLRNDINRHIRQLARNELLLEEFVRAVEENKYYQPTFQRLKKQKENTEHVLAFSDVHFGKEFKSATNEYNISIVEKRFEELYNEVCEYVEENNVSLLHIVNLGDSIEGMYLRISQLRSLQIGLVDQVMQFTNLLINWLSKISEIVKVNYYAVKSSNHSQTRPFESKPNEFVLEDMERMINYNLKLVFDCPNSRVKIIESKDKFLSFNLLGYEIVLLHGHEIRNYNSLLKDIAWKYRKFYDYAFVGHKHVSGIIGSGESDTNNCEVIRVPSIMGSDEYADQLLVGNKAGAIFVEFNKRQGKRRITDVILN